MGHGAHHFVDLQVFLDKKYAISQDVIYQLLLLVKATSLFPVITGIRNYSKLHRADKMVFFFLGYSIFFDFNYLLTGISSMQIAHFYPFGATIIWGLAYYILFEKFSKERRIIAIALVLAIVSTIYLMALSDLGDPQTKGSVRAPNHLFLIFLATVYFFHVILNNDMEDFLKSSFFWYSAMNLIHFAITIVLFTFMDVIRGQDATLYSAIYIKWVLIVISNCLIAYVFYSLGKGSMKSS